MRGNPCSNMRAIRYYPRHRFGGEVKRLRSPRKTLHAGAVDDETGTLKQDMSTFVEMYQVLKEQTRHVNPHESPSPH